MAITANGYLIAIIKSGDYRYIIAPRYSLTEVCSSGGSRLYFNPYDTEIYGCYTLSKGNTKSFVDCCQLNYNPINEEDLSAVHFIDFCAGKRSKNVSKEDFEIEKDASLKNNSYNLTNKKFRNEKEAENLEIIENLTNNKPNKLIEDISISNKRILEQIERRKLLEEYKRKKNEKKISVQNRISSKTNLKKATTKIKREIISSYSKNKIENQTVINKLKSIKNSEKAIKIKKEITDEEKKENNTFLNSQVIRKTKSFNNIKTVKKEDIHSKLNSTVIIEKPNIVLKKVFNSNVATNKKRSNILIKNDNVYKESKSFVALRQPKLEYDEDLKANTTVILPADITCKNKEKVIPLDIPILKNSSFNKPFLKPSMGEVYKSKNDKKIFNKKLLSLSKKSKVDNSDLSYSPSTPKLKLKILNSPLISSPTSSPTSVLGSKGKSPSHSSLIIPNISSPPKSKKLNNIIHSPSEPLIKSSTFIKANQSFSVINISNERTRSFNSISNINKSFINNEGNTSKKIKLNQDLKVNNRDKKILDKNVLSNSRDELNTNLKVSKELDSTNNLRIIKKTETFNGNHLIKVQSPEEKNDKKKNNSCPHYLMPTANWKTKTVKTVNEKKNIAKQSPINKSKVSVKLLSSSKIIKKKSNIIKSHLLLNSTPSNNIAHTIVNNSNILNNTHINNSIHTPGNAKTINNTNTAISKSNDHHLYTRKSTISNTINNNTITSKMVTSSTNNKLSTPTLTRSKSINNSCRVIKGNKKERSNTILSRSSTIPVSTPSKRINKNIKRNNIAFTEENEQDINRIKDSDKNFWPNSFNKNDNLSKGIDDKFVSEVFKSNKILLIRKKIVIKEITSKDVQSDKYFKELEFNV
ncbi:hypothetical protein PIROE2DRAFT_6978 [Piromyces sp. E2]|nr:hypothetical protein PIROE2DRAFT_6978 [Piromyces sp. E2]|eukprot:OUM65908.1 hypothetical protein PIROE2DRAFT_6978 [Piromyces sp. E2]